MENSAQKARIEEILVTAFQKAMLGKLDPKQLLPECNLRDDMGLDSLSMIEMVWEIEEKLGIHIGDQQLKAITTVGEFIETVTTLVNEKEEKKLAVGN